MPWAPKPPCRTPGCPHLTPCPTHPARPRPPRQLAKTTSRGYGWQHQQARAALAPRIATGTIRCGRCGSLIRPGDAWDLDHRPDGSYQPAHAHCNRSAGGQLGAAARRRRPR